jgi:4-hydroxy-4-methyl-2-oxoglutarate aldolase
MALSANQELIQLLARLDSCTVANAIETFDVRLRNTGFTDSSVRCIFGEMPPMVGYATTARVRTSEPPMEGSNYFDRTDWWNHILTIPAPRIVVVEDTDLHPGLGAFIGELHANILLALGCVGVVTNGAVRDLPAVRAAGFQMFARTVPIEIAGKIPSVAERMNIEEQKLIALCKSKNFTIENFREALKSAKKLRGAE